MWTHFVSMEWTALCLVAVLLPLVQRPLLGSSIPPSSRSLSPLQPLYTTPHCMGLLFLLPLTARTEGAALADCRCRHSTTELKLRVFVIFYLHITVRVCC